MRNDISPGAVSWLRAPGKWRLAVRCAVVMTLCGLCHVGVSRAESLRDVIDREIERQAGGKLAPPADDAEFLRRVTLDLTGMPPTAAAARKFLQDADPGKREKLVDQLLGGKEFPRRMREVLTAMLLERRADAKIPEPQWKGYLENAIAKNRPWNEVVAELIFSEPDANKKLPAPARFFLVSGRNDPHQKTQDVARLFLGRDIQCAQCHDHPHIEDFTQADYFGLYAFLQDSAAKARMEFESVFLPGKKTTGPRLPGGKELTIPTFTAKQAAEAKKHRPRLLLAKQLPATENPLFARNAVNRFWFLLIGRGLVHPLDMHTKSNPPSHPKLLAALAEHFVKSNYNLRQLIRELVLSKTYGRSSRLPEDVDPKSPPPLHAYRSAISRPLSPEQMAWSILQVTGNLERLRQAPAVKDSKFTYKDYLNGRIAQAPDNLADAMKLFVGVFGNPPGQPEDTFNPAMGHALFLMNERLILEWLTPAKSDLVRRLIKLDDSARLAEELYLSVLTRKPLPAETQEVADYLTQFRARRPQAIAELAWALLCSAEFRSNH